MRAKAGTIWIILATIGAVLIGLLAYVGPLETLRGIVIAVTEDTEYAEGYSERGFRSIAIGDTEASVRTSIGAPLREAAAVPHTCWLYTRDPVGDYRTTGRIGMITCIEFRFDEAGRLTDVHGQISTAAAGRGTMTIGPGANSLSLSPAAIDQLKATRTTKMQVAARFGRPNASFESRAVKWLHYSHSPGSTNYRMRSIGIDRDGRVCRKVSRIYWD